MNQGKSGIGVTSFYGARVQQEKQHYFPQFVDYNNSDIEGESDNDELDVDFDKSDVTFSESDSSVHDDSSSEEENGDHNEENQNNVARKKGPHQLRWRERNPVQYNVEFTGDPFPPPPIDNLTPLQYFKQIFDDELIDFIVEQTNLYSVQRTGKSVGVDKNEMEKYLGILIMMSVIKLPQVRLYWSMETRVSSVLCPVM